MALTHAAMDRKIDEHFGFEARDDVEGVLQTLTTDVEHDIVGSPLGPTRGREEARAFYQGLFSDLSESKVETVRRLYGARPARHSGSKVGVDPSNSGCCTSCSSRLTATSDARTCGSTSPPSSANFPRIER